MSEILLIKKAIRVEVIMVSKHLSNHLSNQSITRIDMKANSSNKK